MESHKGSCHCRTVVFEVTGNIREVHICNCSICTKKGIVHSLIDNQNLRIISGENSLSVYQCGTKEASHWFCKTCGIHVFGRPRMNPKRYTVNVRCLDHFERIFSESREVRFNGKQHPLDDRTGREIPHPHSRDA
jgi:hypothetical protein